MRARISAYLVMGGLLGFIGFVSASLIYHSHHENKIIQFNCNYVAHYESRSIHEYAYAELFNESEIALT